MQFPARQPVSGNGKIKNSLRKRTPGVIAALVLVTMAVGASAFLGNPAGGSLPRSFEIQWPGDKRVEISEFGYDLYLRGAEFMGECNWPDTFYLETASVLEYVPMIRGKEAPGVLIETHVLDGAGDRIVDRSPPHLINAVSMTVEERFHFLRKPVRVDLSRFTGREVSFRWTVAGSAADAAAYVISPVIKPARARARKTRRPDILVVCSDAHRYDFSLGGEGPSLMPNLAALAAEGVAYHRAYGTASWTLPSITSVFTGLYPRFHKTGERTLGDATQTPPLPPVPPGLFRMNLGDGHRLFGAYPREIETLSERLRNLGYFTAMIVANGFYTVSGLAFDGQDLVIHSNNNGERLNRHAGALLDSTPEGAPRFLVVHYMDVHQFLLWNFRKKYPDAELAAYRDEMLESYAEAAAETDRHLGELLEAWRGRVDYNNSLVVFFSDHGEHLLDAGRDLVDHGITVDEVLLHVPLVIKYPRKSRPKEDQSETPVSLVDLAPTILETAGVTWDDALSGQSLLARMGKAGGRRLFTDYQLYGKELSTVRENPYKLVMNASAEVEYLQDISRELSERGELGQIARDGQVERRLERAFQDYAATAGDRARSLKSDQVVNEKESIEKLRAIGYVK